MEQFKVDAQRHHAMGLAVVAARQQSGHAILAAGCPTGASRDAVAFDRGEWRRIVFGYRLTGPEHQRSIARRPPRDLSTGHDVRFLPTVHDVPGATQNFVELASIEKEMDSIAEKGRHRFQMR